MISYDDVSVKHNFTNAEMAALARDQARKLGEKGVLESELGAVKKDFAGRIETCDAQIKSMSARISAGFEYRNVKCILLDERPEGYRLVVRTDTGRIVKRRKLEQSERQITLTTEPPKPYVAVALLPVDDETWYDTDLYQCPVRESEFDALRGLVEMQPYNGFAALIEG